VLHRDPKPANIMIDGRGQVRITDFGLAALAQEIPLADIRSGTPAYMSLEQKAGKEVTTRSDIYSLGLVFYEMFTGKRRSVVYVIILATLLIGSAIVAWRNLRLGRGDRRGAAQIAAVVFLVSICIWIPVAEHVSRL
jgi:Protein kinase domain